MGYVCRLPRLYTSNLKDAPDQVVRQNCFQILSLILPGVIVSHRSAIENKISPDGRIYVTADYSRILNLPGLEIVVMMRPGRIPDRVRGVVDSVVLNQTTQGILDLLQGAGVSVVPRPNIHRKFALIDQRVVWYGSINLLSFGSAEESIMRLESPNIACELSKCGKIWKCEPNVSRSRQ